MSLSLRSERPICDRPPHRQGPHENRLQDSSQAVKDFHAERRRPHTVGSRGCRSRSDLKGQFVTVRRTVKDPTKIAFKIHPKRLKISTPNGDGPTQWDHVDVALE